MTIFQESKWYVKLWRYRHYAYIPFKWLSFQWHFIDRDPVITKREAWSVLVGSAQCDMNWIYTSEEVFKEIKKGK